MKDIPDTQTLALRGGQVMLDDEVTPADILIENYRTARPWKLFMSIPEIQLAMKRLKFEVTRPAEALGGRKSSTSPGRSV